MIEGIGTDIIEIKRIRESIHRRGDAFIHKIFTLDERKYCQTYKDPIPHYAGRFAAKEAIAKALGLGIGKKLGFQDINIKKDSSGKPIVHFSPSFKKKLGAKKVHLSISHCKTFATATAIITS